MRVFAVLAVGLLLLAGCSSPKKDLPPEWQGRDLDAPGWQNTTVRAGWSFGLEYALPQGRTVTWDWVAVQHGVLYFQLLLMLNGQAIPVHEMHGNASKGSYTTRQAGSYYLTWDLDNLPDTPLYYRVPEGGIRYDWPPGQGPGCPTGLLLC